MQKKNDSSIKNFTFYDLISPHFTSVIIHKVIINDGSIRAAKKDTGDYSISCPSVHLELDEVLVDSAAASVPEILVFKNASFVIKNLYTQFSNGLYKMGVSQIAFNLKNSLLSIDSLLLSPTVDKKDFAKRRGSRTTCFSILLAHTQIYSHQFAEFIYHRNVFLDSIEIGYAKLSGYRDKNLQREVVLKNLPQANLDSLHFKLDVRKFKVEDADVFYEELIPGNPEPGHISFNKVNADFKGITNMHPNDTLTLDISGMVMKQGVIKVKMKFPLSKNEFHADASVGPFDMSVLNSMVKNVAPIKIESGHANNLTLSCTANQMAGYGQIIFKYSNLKVRASDNNKKGYQGLLGNLKIMLANATVDDNNPEDNILRIGKIDYTRDPTRSIIHYFWNLVFSGIKSSIGITEEKLKIKLNEESP